MLERLNNLDRRWVYLLVALGVILPLIYPLKLPVGVSQPARDVYEQIEGLPPNSLVWMGFDYYATTRAETEPGAVAVARHLFRKGHRIVATSLIPDGALLSRGVLDRLARQEGKKYGTDYAIMGYKAGNQVAIRQMCANFQSVFPTDMEGSAIAKLPVVMAFRNHRDIAMMFTVSDTMLFDYYAIVANTEYGVPVSGAATAVMVPTLQPYVSAKQIVGILGGLKGAAEYETFTGMPGDATRGMDAQSVVHLVIVGLIIVSNVAYFSSLRAARRRA